MTIEIEKKDASMSDMHKVHKELQSIIYANLIFRNEGKNANQITRLIEENMMQVNQAFPPDKASKRFLRK